MSLVLAMILSTGPLWSGGPAVSTGSVPSAAPVMAKADTLVDVRRGDRLVLEDFRGDVSVETWERTQMSLTVEADESTQLRVLRDGDRLNVALRDRRGRRQEGDLSIVLPEWMALELSGREMEARVRGVTGEVTVRSLEGDLSLRELAGNVDAYTVEGSIQAEGLTGPAHLRTGDDDLWVVDCSGPLDLESVDGDMEIEGVRASRLSARTTDGDIEFSGSIPEGAEVDLHSHGGDLTVRLPQGPDLEVTVLPYSGDFESEFPVRTERYRSGEPLEFILGSGGARLLLEAFSGDIELLRG